MEGKYFEHSVRLKIYITVSLNRDIFVGDVDVFYHTKVDTLQHKCNKKFINRKWGFTNILRNLGLLLYYNIDYLFTRYKKRVNTIFIVYLEVIVVFLENYCRKP